MPEAQARLIRAARCGTASVADFSHCGSAYLDADSRRAERRCRRTAGPSSKGLRSAERSHSRVVGTFAARRAAPTLGNQTAANRASLGQRGKCTEHARVGLTLGLGASSYAAFPPRTRALVARRHARHVVRLSSTLLMGAHGWRQQHARNHERARAPVLAQKLLRRARVAAEAPHADQPSPAVQGRGRSRSDRVPNKVLRPGAAARAQRQPRLRLALPRLLPSTWPPRQRFDRPVCDDAQWQPSRDPRHFWRCAEHVGWAENDTTSEVRVRARARVRPTLSLTLP